MGRAPTILVLALLIATRAGGAPIGALPGAGQPAAVVERYALELGPGADSLASALGAMTAGPLPRAEIAEIAGRIRDLLFARGELDAVVRLTLIGGADLTPRVARLTVLRPGGGLRSTAVVTGGGDAVPDPSNAFERGSGGGCDVQSLAKGLTALRADAQARGRYGAETSIDSVVVEPGGRACVHVRLNPGPPVTVDTIALSGTTTKPSVLASIAGLTKGRVVTPSLLDAARERLEASGLFSSVGSLEVHPGPDPSRGRILGPVVENRASHFEGALGLQGGGSATGLIDLGLGNIGGTGRSAGARWAGFGGGRSEYAAKYRELSLLGRGVDASLSLLGEVFDSLYTQTLWSLAVDSRLLGRLRAGAALRKSGTVYSGAGRGESGTFSVEGRLAWGAPSPPWNPTRGAGLKLQLETGKRADRAPGIPEERRGLFRGALTCEAARSAGGSRALYAAVRAERVSLGQGAFPVEELRYLGGSEGLRGHADRAHAGNRILALSFEHRWLSRAPGARTYLFFDAARHDLDAPVEAGGASAATSLSRTELSPGWEFGYGAGLRSPVGAGTVGIELGIMPGAALREAKLHLHYGAAW